MRNTNYKQYPIGGTDKTQIVITDSNDGIQYRFIVSRIALQKYEAGESYIQELFPELAPWERDTIKFGFNLEKTMYFGEQVYTHRVRYRNEDDTMKFITSVRRKSKNKWYAIQVIFEGGAKYSIKAFNTTIQMSRYRIDPQGDAINFGGLHDLKAKQFDIEVRSQLAKVVKKIS